MKKELLIVILAVVGIIGISILLKYVIFAGTVIEESKNVCKEICAENNFSFGRCGCDCSEAEKKFEASAREVKKIQKGCDAGFETKPALPCAWSCCCK